MAENREGTSLSMALAMDSYGSPKFSILKIQFADNQHGVFQALTSGTKQENSSGYPTNK